VNVVLFCFSGAIWSFGAEVRPEMFRPGVNRSERIIAPASLFLRRGAAGFHDRFAVAWQFSLL
jgi:hypothetical protein